MLTKWGKYAAQMALVMNTNRKVGVQIKDASGTDQYYFGRNTAWPGQYNGIGTVRIGTPAWSANDGIYVGSGTITPTETDYTLAAPITSGLSATVSVAGDECFDSDGNPQVKQVITLTNTSSGDITISEIGWFAKQIVYSSNNTVNGSGRLVMMDRTVLNSPVTIPAGESAAITYTIKVVLPSS